MEKPIKYYEFPNGRIVKIKDNYVHEYFADTKTWKVDFDLTHEFTYDRAYGEPCVHLRKKADLSDDLPAFPNEKEFYPRNIVNFGAYPQESENDFSSIQWIVLSTDEETALCISKKALITCSYCNAEETLKTQEALFWENSLARQICNKYFYEDAFSEEEKKRIVPQTISSLRMGKKCTDPVFLLSEEQVIQYFPSEESRKAIPTTFAKENGALLYPYKDSDTIFAFWWILPQEEIFIDPQQSIVYPKAVLGNGEIRYHGRNIYHVDFTLRPCVRIRFVNTEKVRKISKSQKAMSIDELQIKSLKKTGLIYTPLTKKAMQISFEVHKNQKDKSGMPYFIHPLHLAEQMETEAEICTALLHDVVEDGDYSIEDLKKAGFPEEITDAVQLLTRREDEDYFDYVARVRQNPIARRVKLVDLTHNSDLSRIDNPSEKDRIRAKKYHKAMEILQFLE
jgi:hypothetical protein